ncbi:MAG: MATE family efflux transporter [Spirochaetaceae bacterium]
MNKSPVPRAITSADLSFVPKLLWLGLPIAGQHLLMTALNMIDTIMVGQLGEAEIGAVALGNQIYFLLVLYLFGVGSGASVFTAQFWGKRDIRNIRRSLGVALSLGLAGAGLFSLGGVAFPRLLLSLYSKDAAVLGIGSDYLRLVALSYIFTAVSMTLANVLRSVGDTRLPLIATGVSIALNSLFNYFLIFGVWIFPELGVRGAAISTAVARTLEMVIMLFVIYRRRGPLAASLSELLDFDRSFFQRFLRRAAPVILNEIGWSVGFTMYTVVYARMGTPELAAYNISEIVSRLAFVFFAGTGNAAAVVIGNAIGEGDEERAASIGRSLILLAPVTAAFFGGVVFLLSPIIPNVFAVSPEVKGMITALLRFFSFTIIAKVTNMHIIVGILRGGGDTTYALFLDVGMLWIFGVVSAFYFGLVLGLPVHLVYLIHNSEEVGKLLFGLPRVLSGRWVNNVTEPAPEIATMEMG